MPKKKLFDGSNYVGAPVSDAGYRALCLYSVYSGRSIADIIRVLVDSWAKSPHSAIPQDKVSAIEKIVSEGLAQRKVKNARKK